MGRVWYGKVGEGTPYFGVNQDFVRLGMNGRLQDTMVIMMGCKGLFYTDTLASAFVEKGAKFYVGWNDSLLASHTDRATSRLLLHLIEDGKTVGEAVSMTMQDVGPDPVFDSHLEHYSL